MVTFYTSNININ